MTNPENPSIHTEPVPPVCDQRSLEDVEAVELLKRTSNALWERVDSDMGIIEEIDKALGRTRP